MGKFCYKERKGNVRLLGESFYCPRPGKRSMRWLGHWSSEGSNGRDQKVSDWQIGFISQVPLQALGSGNLGFCVERNPVAELWFWGCDWLGGWSHRCQDWGSGRQCARLGICHPDLRFYQVIECQSRYRLWFTQLVFLSLTCRAWHSYQLGFILLVLLLSQPSEILSALVNRLISSSSQHCT